MLNSPRTWEPTDNLGFRADQRNVFVPMFENADLGFCIALSLPVPEPSTFLLAAAAILGVRCRSTPSRRIRHLAPQTRRLRAEQLEHRRLFTVNANILVDDTDDSLANGDSSATGPVPLPDDA